LEGTFDEDLIPQRSGTSAAWITYRSEIPFAGKITCEGEWNGAGFCVNLDGKSYIRIENLHVVPTPLGWLSVTKSTKHLGSGGGKQLVSLQQCNHIRLTGNLLEGSTNFLSILSQNMTHSRFENNIIQRGLQFRKGGMANGDLWHVRASSHNVWVNNTFSKSPHSTLGFRGTDIGLIDDYWTENHHNVVRGNTFDNRNGRNGAFTWISNSLFENNVLTNSHNSDGSLTGISKLSLENSIFRRNLVVRNWAGTWRGQQFQGATLSNSRIYHNTFARNALRGFDFGSLNSNTVGSAGPVKGNILVNNIFAQNDLYGDNLALQNRRGFLDVNDWHRNLISGSSPGERTVLCDDAKVKNTEWIAARYTTAEAETLCPGFGPNVDFDPGFVDAASANFHLAPSSAAIDAGAHLTQVTSAGTGSTISVADPFYFYDGYGIDGESGDWIMVGTVLARVVRVDTTAKTLELDRSIDVFINDTVSLPFSGAAPDLGAFEENADVLWALGPDYPASAFSHTMETATHVVVRTDFEEATREEWDRWWNIEGELEKAEAVIDDKNASAGRFSLSVAATENGSNMEIAIEPDVWDTDRFPWVSLSYKLTPGTPLGIRVWGFPTEARGHGAICVGRSTTGKCGGGLGALDNFTLVDDGEWHQLKFDVRVVRETVPELRVLMRLDFYTNSNANVGHKFWFDDFEILPTEEVLNSAPTSTGASTTAATGTEDIRTSNLPLIVGVSVGVAVLIAAAVILTVALVSLRRRRGNLGGEGMGPSYIPMRSKN
jgi:hypothetical protein